MKALLGYAVVAFGLLSLHACAQSAIRETDAGTEAEGEAADGGSELDGGSPRSGAGATGVRTVRGGEAPDAQRPSGLDAGLDAPSAPPSVGVDAGVTPGDVRPSEAPTAPAPGAPTMPAPEPGAPTAPAPGAPTMPAPAPTMPAPAPTMPASMPDAVPPTSEAGGAKTGSESAPAPVVPQPAAPPTCSDGTMLCGASCVDTRSSLAHCGGCNIPCRSGESCVASRCGPALPAGCSLRLLAQRPYLLCSQPRSWNDARRVCQQFALDLAVIASAAENDAVRAGVTSESWIGASDGTLEGSFRAPVRGDLQRIDGAVLTYTSWAQGEPSNTPHCAGSDLAADACDGGPVFDEDCVLLRPDGSWNDADCGVSRPYVCGSVR